MDFKDDLKQLKQANQNVPVKAENKPAVTSFEEAKDKALSEFKPQYDTNKSMYENGKDIVKTIAVNEALKDEEFVGEIKTDVQENIKTDLDTDKKKSQFENQGAFYKKHKPVLMFARMKEPSDLALMKWTYGFAVVPYFISLIIGGIFSLVAMFFESINALFNSIIGVPEYLTDKNGELIKDSQGNLITKNVKVNLLTKIVFWTAFAIMCLIIVLSVVKGITGFDVIKAIKKLVNG